MTNGPDHPSYPVVRSRPIAQEIAVQHEGQAYQAISPIPWPPVQVVRDGLRQVLRQEAIPIAVRFLPHATLAGLGQAQPSPTTCFTLPATAPRTAAYSWSGRTARPTRSSRPPWPRHCAAPTCGWPSCQPATRPRPAWPSRLAASPPWSWSSQAWPMDARAAALFNGQFYTWLARGRRPREAFDAGGRAVKGDAVLGARAAAGRPRHGRARALLLGAVPGVHGGRPSAGRRRAGGRVPRGAAAAGGVHRGRRRHLCRARVGADSTPSGRSRPAAG